MKSAVAHDAPLGVALAAAKETTEEAIEETADMMETAFSRLGCERRTAECWVCSVRA